MRKDRPIRFYKFITLLVVFSADLNMYLVLEFEKSNFFIKQTPKEIVNFVYVKSYKNMSKNLERLLVKLVEFRDYDSRFAQRTFTKLELTNH